MAKPWDITGDDITLWSQRFEASSVLPDLLRRLLLATASLSSLTMSAHAGTRLRGLDGVVRAYEEAPFCPAGLSVWELTVEEDKHKLNGDLDKRTANPGAIIPRETTYVAVSARRVNDKERWLAEKNVKRIWREVRLLDAEDLAAWLTRAPAVARWFAAQIGRPVDDLEDLDAFLDAWCRRTRPPLPRRVALLGRERQRLVERVRAWARSARLDWQSSEPLRVHGDTWEEAAVFAAAALILDATTEGEQVRVRTVVARSEAALREVLRADHAQPLIAIAAYEQAAVSVGPVVLPLQGPLPAAAFEILRLSATPYLRFAEALQSAGMAEPEAQRVASRSGGKLATLQRLLGYVELPRWAQGIAPLPLYAMLLAGSFEPGNSEDRAVLEILGASANEVELLCERLRVGPDAPTLKEQGRGSRAVWRWRSLEDPWRALASQIPAASLQGFGDAIRRVLGERDPKFDLEPDQRFAAPFHGKTLRASGALREGLVRSLVYLSLSDAVLAPLHGPQRGSLLAKVVVRDVLPPPWAPWASLAELLPLLSEAAPEMFLECLEESLHEGDAGAAHLLAQEASFGGSPHTGLLWALETLGWDERLLPRVAAALAKLAQFDAKLDRRGRMANRPKASLEGLLSLTVAQTCAPAEARIREMARRLQETPDIGFPLLVGQLTKLASIDMTFPAHRPELLPLDVPSRDALLERANSDFSQVANAYLDLALAHAGHDAERWAYFLKKAHVIHTPVESRILERLEEVRSRIVDEQAELWGALRHVLHWSRPLEDAPTEAGASEPPPREEHDRWKRLYEALTPGNLALRYAWLFLRSVDLPDGFQAPKDLGAEDREIARRRVEAIEDIGRRDDRLQVLSALGDKVRGDDSLGWAMANATFAHELDAHLLEETPPASLAAQVPTYLARRWIVEGRAWVETKLRAMVAQGRTKEVKNTLHLFPGSTEIWDLVDALGEEVWRCYWQDLEYVSGEHSADEWERAIKNLLAARNTFGALLNANSAKQQISAATIAEALKALLANHDQLVRADRHGISSWVLEQLMDRLEASPEVESRYAQLLAKVEILYAVQTLEPKRPMRRLSAYFAGNPNQFVDLVTQMYRPRSEPRPALSQAEQAEVKKRAATVHRVLHSWTGYPGQGLPDDERESVLYDWSLRALRALAAVKRAETGASEVAKVLARAPAAADGLWPCLAARRLLEGDEFPVLSRCLEIAEYNLRNGRLRPVSGETERTTANGFRDAARALRSTYPRTAILLDRLAESYEREAAHHDAYEERTLREEGAEPSDFDAPSARPAPSPKHRILKPGIVHLNKIELTNFAIIDHLTLDLEPREGGGQWVLLVGDNGKGKTTLLRALALVLAGTNLARVALGQSVAPLIRIGTNAARCNVTCAGVDFSITLTNDGTAEAATCEPANGHRPPVFAYGCLRGSAFGGNSVADPTNAFSDVATLFSKSASLYPAQSWLQDLKRRSLQEEKYAEIFSTVITNLCGLLPDVAHIDVAGNEVWVIGPKLGGRVPLAALSDGYLTTLSWLVDLIARWINWAEQEQADLTGNFFERMEGLVLVDEIDLHLDARWQHSIIRTLKVTFPRLSFVVTMHNLLTLVGAEKGEIVVLREKADGTGGLEARQIDLPPGAHADRALTREWFGLLSTVDYETYR
ncbi:AAA family ATPase [Sorangium sp. So ce1024]|uniref:AAA family ATPase n=1 Tax=Sorangium sp. So ce1024 TaxID=3133327 RepID=UPI003F026DEE